MDGKSSCASERRSITPLFLRSVARLSTTICVLHGKGDGARTAGIDSSALTIVGKWMVELANRGPNATQPLFCTGCGNQVPSSYVRSLTKRLSIQAGISKRVHAHDLRHTHAYELMMENAPIGVIERQLRDSSLSTTGIYLSHIAPKQVNDAISGRNGRSKEIDSVEERPSPSRRTSRAVPSTSPFRGPGPPMRRRQRARATRRR